MQGEKGFEGMKELRDALASGWRHEVEA